MKALKENFSIILIGIAELVVGILLIIDPKNFTDGIIITLGLALNVFGVLAIIKYFRSKPEEAALGQQLFKGLMFISVGLFCVLNFSWFTEFNEIMSLIYGAALFLIGLSKIQWASDILRLKKGSCLYPALGAALSIILGIIIIANPFGEGLTTFTSIALIAGGAYDFFALIYGSILNKKAAAAKQALPEAASDEDAAEDEE